MSDDVPPLPAVMTITAGLRTKAEWPEGLLDKLTGIRQGDVINAQTLDGPLPLVYHACPRAPVWQRTLDYVDEPEQSVVVLSDTVESPRRYVITSQTCDIVESAGEPNHPWVQIAPAFDMLAELNSGERKMVSKRGFSKWLWHLPAVDDGFWVADLRIELPIEKGLLGILDVSPGHLGEEDRRAFGERLAGRRSRPAFSDLFCDVVQKPLVSRLKELRKTDEDLYAQMDLDVEVCARMDNHLDPHVVQVALVCEQPPTPEVLRWWQSWWAEATSPADDSGINLLPLQILYSDQMNVKEYRQFTRLPLDRVSPA
jgi:hypothetical protein